MTDRDKGFRLTATAAGRIPSAPKTRREFPVTVSKGVQKFQRREAGKWLTVCAVPDGAAGRKNLTHHYGTVLGRTEGKDFRFTVHKR